jgi:hypothetical protein
MLPVLHAVEKSLLAPVGSQQTARCPAADSNYTVILGISADPTRLKGAEQQIRGGAAIEEPLKGGLLTIAAAGGGEMWQGARFNPGGKTACVAVPNAQRFRGGLVVVEKAAEVRKLATAHRSALGQKVFWIDPGDDDSWSVDCLGWIDADGGSLQGQAAELADELVIGDGPDKRTDEARRMLAAETVRMFREWAADRTRPRPTIRSLAARFFDRGGIAREAEADDPDGGILSIVRAQLDAMTSSPGGGGPGRLAALLSGDAGRRFDASEVADGVASVFVSLPTDDTASAGGLIMLALAKARMSCAVPKPPILVIVDQPSRYADGPNFLRLFRDGPRHGIHFWVIAHSLCGLKRVGAESLIGSASVIQAWDIFDREDAAALHYPIGTPGYMQALFTDGITGGSRLTLRAPWFLRSDMQPLAV